MTYEDMKRLGLSKYCAVPGEIYKRESDGKYFTVSEDGRKIEVTPEPGMVITGIIPDYIRIIVIGFILKMVH